MVDLRALTVAFLLFPLAAAAQESASNGNTATDLTFPAVSNLKVGVAKTDITPEPGIRVVGHVRKTRGTRDPIRAAVLVLDDGKTRAAIVTTDLIAAWDPMVRDLRKGITAKTGIPSDHIMVTAAHNHSGPGYKEHPAWARMAVRRIVDASAEASKNLRIVTIGYGEDRIDFGINRRKTFNGKSVVRLNPDGLNDPRVKVLRFDDGRSLTPVAVLMHAVCHPCVFTWGDNGSLPHRKGYPLVSADFPGEAQHFVEKVYDGKTQTLFLQGCAGDIRPNLPGFPYRCGDEADIQWAGRSLGCAVVRALARSAVREERAKRGAYTPIRVASEVLQLPGKEGPVRMELMAMKIGPYVLLTLPGEPMVKYAFNVEKNIGDRAIPFVVGYANGGIGYICTAESHKVGGYEPNSSPLKPEAEAILIRELDKLADRVIGDVFETFSKHPKKPEKKKAEKKE